MRVGLTGGLGAGKSTVAQLLAQRGAVVIDADAIARTVVRAGTPGHRAVVARFGPGFVGPDGELDRAALARLVFGDDEARAALNAIVHPLVAQRSAQLMSASPAGSVVVYDVPLLVESGLAGDFDMVVVVEADEDIRLTRLAGRGLSPGEARTRIRAQATDDQRRSVADEIVRNDGSLEQLTASVERLWTRLVKHAAGLVGHSPIG